MGSAFSSLPIFHFHVLCWYETKNGQCQNMGNMGPHCNVLLALYLENSPNSQTGRRHIYIAVWIELVVILTDQSTLMQSVPIEERSQSNLKPGLVFCKGSKIGLLYSAHSAWLRYGWIKIKKIKLYLSISDIFFYEKWRFWWRFSWTFSNRFCPLCTPKNSPTLGQVAVTFISRSHSNWSRYW